jgi:peroxiredoxin
VANDLTGNFDVVAEFTLGAANRVLAAMHSGNRFPHSWSLRVDDTPHSKRIIRSRVDVFGDPIISPTRSAKAPAPGLFAARSPSDPLLQNVDLVVNLGVQQPTVSDPHHLTGFAQLQFGPPTLSLLDGSDDTVVTHSPAMVRYLPDLGSMPIPEYLRGEVEVTIGAQEVFSQAGTFIDVKPVGLAGGVQFNPNPSSALSTDQKKAVNRALANSFVNSFQPSNTPLPPGVLNMRLKALPDAPQALAVLMNLPGGTLAGVLLAGGLLGLDTGNEPDPADVSEIFLKDGDDFALAVSSEFFTAPFLSVCNAVIDSIPEQHLVPQSADSLFGLYSGTIKGEFTIQDATLELLDSVFGSIPGGPAADAALAATRHGTGKILLNIPVKVHINVHFEGLFSPGDKNLNFVVLISQAFDLNLGNGQVTGLNKLFGLSVEVVSGDFAGQSITGGPVMDLAQKQFDLVWNANQGQINDSVSKMFDTARLSQFLDPLTQPTAKPGSQSVQNVSIQLAYSSFEIRSSGIILHGTLQVPDWPQPVVDFAAEPYSITGHNVFASGINYNALKSWIPGGTITEFIWSLSNGPQLRDDRNTFVLPNAQFGMRHLCLTINGARISATDPLNQEAVSRTMCLWSVPKNSAGGLVSSGSGVTGRPKIALVEFAASGGLQVIGHTSVGPPDGNGASNLIVHFPDNKSVIHLDFLTRALQESGRKNMATDIVAVLSHGELSRVRPVEGIMVSDDEQTWSRLLGVKGRPATYVFGTNGQVVWHYRGQLTSADLAAALKTHLVAGGNSFPTLLQSVLRVGGATPNLLFELAAGRQLTLRKLSGQRVVLVFWTSTSRPSLETVLDLQKAFATVGSRAPVLLAINDGETAEIAKRAADEHGITAIVVPDPRQDISSAYGVSIWPTTVFLDEKGLLTDIRYGRFSSELAKYPQKDGDRPVSEPAKRGRPPKTTKRKTVAKNERKFRKG